MKLLYLMRFSCSIRGVGIFFIVVFFGITNSVHASDYFDDIYQAYLNANDGNVLVAAHRGGYRQNGQTVIPENSILAFNNSISLGVDIIEIDVRQTRDGHLVVMHDSTVNRTTNGSGSVSNMTLAQIKSLKLTLNGQITNERVPTLEETMLVAKDHLMVNLDKAYGYREQIITVLQATDTLDHAILKSSTTPTQVAKDLDALDADISFMPILGDGKSTLDLRSSLSILAPQAIETIYSSSSSPLISENAQWLMASADTRMWVNTLWSSLAAGHTDAGGLTDPDGNWGWVIDHGATIIQTDEPEALLNYLSENNLHNVHLYPDVDGNDIVNLDDFYFIRDNFLKTGDDLMGDVNRNGRVDEYDFAFWKQSFLANPRNAVEMIPDLFEVPEPATLAILGLGGWLTIRKRK